MDSEIQTQFRNEHMMRFFSRLVPKMQVRTEIDLSGCAPSQDSLASCGFLDKKLFFLTLDTL